MKRDDGVTKPGERGLWYACTTQMVGLAEGTLVSRMKRRVILSRVVYRANTRRRK